jgi:hypothetical protein
MINQSKSIPDMWRRLIALASPNSHWTISPYWEILDNTSLMVFGASAQHCTSRRHRKLLHDVRHLWVSSRPVFEYHPFCFNRKCTGPFVLRSIAGRSCPEKVCEARSAFKLIISSAHIIFNCFECRDTPLHLHRPQLQLLSISP